MHKHLSAVFALSLAAAALLSACGQGTPGAAQAPAAPQVSVAEVISQPLNEWDEFTGRLEAPQTVEVRPRVSGYVERVAFTEGALVAKGELLFQIDARPFEAEVKRLEGELRRAQARAALTRSERERGARLKAKHAISAEDFDARASAAAEADAGVAATAAALEAAKLNLGFTRITAPIDGRVSNARITEGNLVTAGSSLLTTVVSTDKVYAYFDADESVYLKYAQLAREGRRPSSREHKNPIYLGLANEPGHPHLGHVDFVDNRVNPATGTIRGRAVFDNADGAFTPGLFARLKLVASETYEGVLINERAVATDLSNKFVLVLDKDGKAQYRPVTLGPKLDGLRIVKAGLKAGERIVVNGLQRVRPGMGVTPKPVSMAEPAQLDRLQAQRQAVEDALAAKAQASAAPANARTRS
ncbi:MAG: efflux RND transporter periplasmic adaptor subunit [Gammaproteobacteria bacterium]|nr:efflux RND transporter periplasmic adaptor subunit [Gammaproteobacteria bacterium]